MGVEFKLRRNDHKKVEDFASRQPEAVTGFTIDANEIRHQAAAAEAARANGYDVLVEPLTERLVIGGFEPDGLPYCKPGETLDPVALRTSTVDRQALVDTGMASQADVATKFVPPHFCVEDDLSLRLNLRLVEATLAAADRPVRPILLVRRRFAIAAGSDLADRYAELGITEVDLRITPVGGDDEGVHKIRSIFAIADTFSDAGISVLLGCSGNIGQTALALGHVAGFSVGIGMRERVDHSATLSRQSRPHDDNDDSPHFGPQAGVYLPALAATVGRAAARALLDDRQIRTRIGCRLGNCANNIAGPAADPRDHYLHARAHEVASLLHRPPQWRGSMEADRLQRALDLRQLVNDHHLPADAHPLKTRTIRSLLEGIELEQRRSA